MSLSRWIGFLSSASAQAPIKQRRGSRSRTCRLQLESLEDRYCPSGGSLLVTSADNDTVVRYNETSGAFVDTFVTHRSGGLDEPYGIVFGPHDHNLYVSTGLFSGPNVYKGVLRYDGTTGALLGEFAESGHVDSPRGIVFGPDGNLYVADRPLAPGADPGAGRVVRFNGTTGRFMDEFVPTGSAGRPSGLVFGPSVENPNQLDLYVTSLLTDSISRFDGESGAYKGEFVASGSGGLDYPFGLTFGPDANLYVTSFAVGVGYRAVLRYQGPSRPTPGAFIDEFVPPGSGGLITPNGILFGPDGNGDGRQDLYVVSTDFNGALLGKGHRSEVIRYDGITGAYLNTFVANGNGRLDDPLFMTFTDTDPVTLAYRGDDHLMANSLPVNPTRQTLAATRVQALLGEALRRWHVAGVNASSPDSIDIRIADLGGATLGQAVGHTIWLDDNAAGWGWFVDRTPQYDDEFITPGNQGEKHRIDLLTVLEHEVGHLLGKEHEESGIMAEALATATRIVAGQEQPMREVTSMVFATDLFAHKKHRRHL